MAEKIPISDQDKQDYYPGQAFEWERDPVSGNTVEVPAYVDYINPDGTPHINYKYWEGFYEQPKPPSPEEIARVNLRNNDRNVQIYAAQGMFDPTRQPIQVDTWRPTWLQF